MSRKFLVFLLVLLFDVSAYANSLSKPEVITITISAAGDCTLGGDSRIGQITNFLSEMKGDNYSYYLRNVRKIFEADDLTIVNMEGTFTNKTNNADKKFVFQGPPELAQIFTSSSVEAVTMANNHTLDYLRAGYEDTIATLKAAGIRYFGNEYVTTINVKGINVGLFGYSVWDSSGATRDKITSAIKQLRNNGADIVIAYYHWGVEHSYYPVKYQIDIAHHTIDAGADLVLGSHPHVIQGIAEYKGKNIVYSLGNFCFGGNRNPSDKDSMIFQQTFEFTSKVLTKTVKNIIPCSVSSVKTRNNFQPTVLTGDEAERVLAKIAKYSRINEK